MKANELQLKDWILQNGYPSRVVLLINNYIETEIMADDREPCTFEPVPITEEILEKNGFEKKAINDNEPYYEDEDGYNYYQYGELGTDKYMWFWYKDGMILITCNCTAWMHLYYVHEIQHALRLCGLDELADNFKV